MEFFYALLLSILTLLVGLRISRGSQEENCDIWSMVRAQKELQPVPLESNRPRPRNPRR